LRASTLVVGGSVSLQASIAILLHFECLWSISVGVVKQSITLKLF
jgi:hypothetical protein